MTLTSQELFTVDIPIINQASYEPVSGFRIKIIDKFYRTLATSSSDTLNLTYTTSLPAPMPDLTMSQRSTLESTKTNYIFESTKPLGPLVITLPNCMQFGSIDLLDHSGTPLTYI